MKRILIGIMVSAVVTLIVKYIIDRSKTDKRAVEPDCPYFVETDSKGATTRVFYFSP